MLKPPPLKIFRIDRSIPLPLYATEGSVAMDMYSRTNVEILPGEFARIPLNVVLVDYDPGVHPILVARSSLPEKKNLIVANSIGLIDRDYAGKNDELQLLVFHLITRECVMDDKWNVPVVIHRGERIAQVELIYYQRPQIVEVFEVEQRSRGGLGSTEGYFK
ncbi:MAG: dUTP diphosphatase [Candidatus Caldatribacteriota bacterium]